MHKFLKIKPLSVNKAYKGKKYTTKEYKFYEQEILLYLPSEKLKLLPPYKILYNFGFSSTRADADNPVKVLQDIISRFYGFDDRHIFEINIKKHLVKKGEEFIEFEIREMK
jgi:Holliday junction resolvase RusA-like endonuclease